MKEKVEKEVKEATDKVAEEEKRKKDEKDRNNEIVPKNIDIPKISTIGSSGLSLGLGIPFGPNNVPNLRKLVYDKALGRIVQEQEKKFLVIGGNPISVIT
jgi:hypothetical protein